MAGGEEGGVKSGHEDEDSKNQNWPMAFEQRIGIARMAQG
jgi:hypothetical protein